MENENKKSVFILNFENGRVSRVFIPDGLDEEQTEELLSEEYGFSLNSIEYMITESNEINELD
jgi:hypothetical protein